MKRPGLVLILTLWGGLSLSAATVSFMILETGLGEDQARSDSSILWENSLMDKFFEGGHIVSNAPMRRLPGPPGGSARLPPEALTEFEEARTGGADYFILALLDFEGASGKVLQPRNVRLRLFHIRSGELLAEQGFSGGGVLSPQDERKTVNRAVEQLVNQLVHQPVNRVKN